MKIADYKNTKSGLRAEFEAKDGCKIKLCEGGYEDCIKATESFLEDTGRKSYYTRLVLLEDGLMIDFGSHSEFVYLRRG